MNLRIVVCVKQVPVAASMQFDAATKTLKRDGVRTEVSAFDTRAVLAAVELRNLHGGEVSVLTMGPPQARAALVDCLALGADRAVHVNDAAFAGSDTLATAQALAESIGRQPFDLILCGRYSTDAETGQVGPELAELLDLPQVTSARSIVVRDADRSVEAERETDDGYETVQCPLPALVTVAEDIASERFASKAEKTAAAEKAVEEITAAALGGDPARFGKEGSPTWVAGLEVVEDKRRGEVIEASDPGAAVDRLIEHLRDAGLFSGWKGAVRATNDSQGAPVQRAQPADILVVSEITRGRPRRVSLELLTKAAALANRTGGQVGALILGGAEPTAIGELARHGAGRVWICTDDRLESGVEPAAALLEKLIRDTTPGIVLLPATSFGRDLAPRVAARLRLGLTGDCIDLGFDAEGRLMQYKPAFGGQIVAPILSRTVPEMATVRPGMLACAPSRDDKAEVIDLPLPAFRDRVRVIGRNMEEDLGAALDSAEVVIGVGAGIGGPENLAAFRELGELLDAPLCTTRDVTDKKWLPRQLQVGLTGRAIAPRLYLAFGIRGAFEHTVGIRRAGLIVAVNKNAKAPIFKTADYGIVSEWATVLPLLVDRIRAARPAS